MGVPISVDGALACREHCSSNGYSYFRLECPGDVDGTSCTGDGYVHCQCHSSTSWGEVVDQGFCDGTEGTNCGEHCSGPYEVSDDTSTYYMGTGCITSVYSVDTVCVSEYSDTDCGWTKVMYEA